MIGSFVQATFFLSRMGFGHPNTTIHVTFMWNHVKSCENPKRFSAHPDGLCELQEHLRGRLDRYSKLRMLLRCLSRLQIRWNSCEFMWNHVKIDNWVLGAYNLLIRPLWAPGSLAKYTTSVLEVTNDSPMPPETTNQLKFMWNHVKSCENSKLFSRNLQSTDTDSVRTRNTCRYQSHNINITWSVVSGGIGEAFVTPGTDLVYFANVPGPHRVRISRL